MKKWSLLFLTLIIFTSASAQFNEVSDTLQQNARLSVAIVFGVFVAVVTRYSFAKSNTPDADKLSAAISFGTFLLFLFAVPENTATQLSNYILWVIVLTVVIGFLSFVKGNISAPSGKDMSLTKKLFFAGATLIIISLLLRMLGVDV